LISFSSFQVPQFIQRRQLTNTQQNIFSDIQQHQNRFAAVQNQIPNQQQFKQQQQFGQRNQQSNFVQQPALQAILPTQTQTVFNDRFPPFNRPPPSNPFLNKPQTNNNFRNLPPRPPQQQQQTQTQFGSKPVNTQNTQFIDPFFIQHHTQTNFIPNFLQQLQQQQQQLLPLTQSGPQFNRIQQQRSVINQVQQPQNFFNNQPFQPVANPNFQDVFSSSRPVAAPLIQQQQSQAQPQVRFPEQRFPFAQSTQNTQFGQAPQQIQIQPSLSTQFIPSPPEFIPAGGQQSTFNSFSQQLLPTPQAQQQFPTQNQFSSQQQFQQPQQQQQQRNNFAQQRPQQEFFQQQQQQQQLQQQQQQQQNFNIPSEEELKLLREKEKIIQKHEQFVQKQYQKQQIKVQQEHDEFIKKQQIIANKNAGLAPKQQGNRYQVTRSRGILPQENSAFEQALRKFELEHPTTTTTTTTTPAPPTSAAPISVVPLTTSSKSRNSKSDVSALNAGDLEVLLQGQRQKLLSQILQDPSGKKSKVQSKVKAADKGLGREDLLKQLKLALADQPQEELGDKNYTTQDIVLPNGQKVQVIRTSDPSLIQGGNFDPDSLINAAPATTSSPVSIAELAKSGILPAGADYEVIRQGENGQEVVQKLPQQKKVTFVYLEEQDDGSFKVQGVKGNNDKDVKTSGTEVDSIVNRIKSGDIKLPPQSLKQTTIANPIIIANPNTAKPTSVTVIPLSTAVDQQESDTISRSSTPRPITAGNSIFATESRRSSTPNFSSSQYSTVPTYTPEYSQPSTTQTPFYASSPSYVSSTARFVETTQERQTYSSAPTFAATSPALTSAVPTSTSTTMSTNILELTSVFRNSGLFAMSKYLKQSGLDSILNETGPYTIFVPTDKAFKSLLVQLGGPEKAEEKFKNNPRLLSGVSISVRL
jgi:hypothetical protein